MIDRYQPRRSARRAHIAWMFDEAESVVGNLTILRMGPNFGMKLDFWAYKLHNKLENS